eukprot:TRINITY_DN58178_c0_g1_i1.p1 TRINITY_DN58178_c0_g1~~TRINITY_DN58178_c0_g1_i1.p1  ORF type:complete len:178 (+),score=25.17 TRINITY_DN58178_c0_g1_i1:60-536(+)
MEQFEVTEEEAEKSWKIRVDRNVLVLVTVILMSLLRSVIPGMPYLNMRAQFFCVHLQLMVIVGLSRDGGRSWLSWICRSRVVLFLGRHSMAIYLLHDPVVIYLIFHVLLDQESIVPFTMAALVSLVMAVIMTELVEKPLKKCFQKKISSNSLGIIVKY